MLGKSSALSRAYREDDWQVLKRRVVSVERQLTLKAGSPLPATNLSRSDWHRAGRGPGIAGLCEV